MTLAMRGALALKRLLRRLPLAGLAIVAPFVVVSAGFVTHHEALLRYLLPAFLPICALILYYRNRQAYMSFILAVWFFIPLLRRLVDYRAGWVDPNPMLLAAYSTSLIVPLIRLPAFLKTNLQRSFPFLLCLVGIAFGSVSGIFAYHLTSVVHDFANWLTPIAFAAFLVLEQEDNEDYLVALERWLPLWLVLSAAYTILQFVLAFPWDMAWLTNLDAPSMGVPEPFGFRAFGNLNSAGTAAFVFSTGALYVLNLKRWWRLPVFGLITVALLTTQVRAGWLALAIGFFISLVKLPRRTVQPLLVLIVLGVGASIVGLEGDAAVITDRIHSFTEAKNDDSANGRLQGLQVAWNDLETHPFGHGLGVPEDIFNISGSFSLLDSFPVHLFVTFGWLGGAAYLAGLLSMLLPVLGGILHSRSRRYLLTAIPAVALCSIFLLGSVTVALSGMLVWMFLPLSLYTLAEESAADPFFHLRMLELDEA
jgi:hypothetical protein